MKNNASKAKRAPAAAGSGMLPSDEQQGGFAQEESGHRKIQVNEAKAFARGIHQQSIKESQAAKTQKPADPPGAAPVKSSPPAAPGAENADAPITRTTLVMDIVYKYPDAVEVLVAAGLHCVGCQLSVYDDFQTGCAIHGFDDKTIDELVVKMNEAVRAAQAPAKKGI